MGAEVDTSREAVERQAIDIADPCSTVTSRLHAVSMLRALLARAEAAEKARDEALEQWPEWAKELLKMLHDFGWEYDAEECIDIAAEVKSWADDVEAACRADVGRITKQRDAAIAERDQARSAISLAIRCIGPDAEPHDSAFVLPKLRAALGGAK